MRFLDTNIFLRFLLNDDTVKSPACLQLLRRIDAGDEEATTSESVVAEIFFVLTREKGKYHFDRVEVVERVKPLMNARGMRLGDGGLIARALDVFAAFPRLDFEDALSVAHVELNGRESIVSFDGGFDGVTGLTRTEP